MTNYQFLQMYTELQWDIMFDKIYDFGYAAVCYGQVDSSPFWNNALLNHSISDDEITAVEEKLISLERKPAFYFEDRRDMQEFADHLIERGYAKKGEDSFMFHNGENIEVSQFNDVRKVMTNEDLDVFITTFDHCFQNDDPQNPYGELGEYLHSAKAEWLKHHESNKMEYFIAYKNEQPVAVATLTNYKKLGYISNVGSLRSVRGEGFGKLVTHFCVAHSKANGNNEHFLATEEGTYPNQFYTMIGFETKFCAKLLVKE